MSVKFKLMQAMLAGFFFNVMATQELSAQNKPPAYIVVEVEVTDPVGYQVFLDKNTPLVLGAGGRWLSRGENIVKLDGEAPKRFAIIAFENMEKAMAYREMAAYKEIMTLRDKSSIFRSFIVDGTVSGTLTPK